MAVQAMPYSAALTSSAPDSDDGAVAPSFYQSQSPELLLPASHSDTGHARGPASMASIHGSAFPAAFVSQYVAKETRKRLKGASSTRTRLETARAIVGEANRRHLDPLLLMAMIQHESRFNTKALGLHGEIGLMQIKPSTAAWIAKRAGVEFHGKEQLKDPVYNVRIGAAYVSLLKRECHGRGLNYLAAYNMGPRALRSLPALSQPREYADKVLAEYRSLLEGMRLAAFVDGLPMRQSLHVAQAH